MLVPRHVPNLLKLAFIDWAGKHGDLLAQGARELWHDNPLEHWGELAERVQSGEFEILFLTEDGTTEGEPVGWSIYEIREDCGRREFFSIASFSKFKDFSMTEHCIPILIEKARELECETFAMGTLRPALIKEATETQDFRVSMVELRKEL